MLDKGPLNSLGGRVLEVDYFPEFIRTGEMSFVSESDVGHVGEKSGICSITFCRGPAPADPGYSKERRHRRPIYLNIYQRYKE